MAAALYVVSSLLVFTLTGWFITNEFHRKERAELYSRLMARDLHEYSLTQPRQQTKKPGNFMQDAIKRAYRGDAHDDDD